MLLKRLFNWFFGEEDASSHAVESSVSVPPEADVTQRARDIVESAVDADAATMEASHAIADAAAAVAEADALAAVLHGHPRSFEVDRLVDETVDAELEEQPSRAPMKGARAPKKISQRRVREGKRRKGRSRHGDPARERRMRRRRTARKELSRR